MTETLEQRQRRKARERQQRRRARLREQGLSARGNPVDAKDLLKRAVVILGGFDEVIAVLKRMKKEAQI